MNDNNNGAFRNVSTQPNPNREESDSFLHNFTPMIDTLQNMNQSNPADSACTKFIRKKFICICIFFMTVMTIMYFFTSVTEKLSQNDVQQIYRGFVQVIRKIAPNTPLTYKNNSIEYTLYDNNTKFE
jgi:hypothetical protein